MNQPGYDQAMSEEEDKLLESRVLEEMFNGIGIDKAMGIMDELYKDMEVRECALMQALERDDLKALRLNAHSLASESASFGLARLSRRCKLIEGACDRADYKVLQELSPTLAQLISQSGQALKAYQPL